MDELQQTLATDPDPARREAAAEGLGLREEQAAEAAPTLAAALRDVDVRVRKRSAWALGKVGRWEHPLLEALGQGVGDTDPGVREAACLALALAGEEGALTASQVSAHLDDSAGAAVRKFPPRLNRH